MWGRKGKAKTATSNEGIIDALIQQQKADVLIKVLEEQDIEIAERVTRLAIREKKNNFGEALQQAMMKRAATQ